MTLEILSVAQCYEADKFAAAHGLPTLALMENAGRAIAGAITERWERRPVLVLCGPGNNGGDGFVAARLLRDAGWNVRLMLSAPRSSLKGDAAAMAAKWNAAPEGLDADGIAGAELIVDALFGAGLSRALKGEVRRTVEHVNASGLPVVAVDVPSGVQGDSGKVLGDCAVRADLTVTFFCKKLAHVLMPSRAYCGEILVADIGIPDAAIGSLHPNVFENAPGLWRERFPWPGASGHKYARGHCVVVSGPAQATGAARLAARGALRAGAGLVSVASPQDAVSTNAAHLTAIMVKPFTGAKGLADLLSDKRLNSVAIGPGCGVGRATQEMAAAVLGSEAAVVIDADGLTSFQEESNALFRILREPAVLTPHDGEFERVFPGLLNGTPSRIEAVRAAASAANCTVLLKGPDTAIASPDGRVAVCTNAPPWLATAGSGDVLTGMIAGLLAQGMMSFDAACAGAWLHGEAANCFGIGLIAEDIPEMLPAVLQDLHDT